MAAAPQSTTTQNLREFRQPPPARLSRGGLDAGLLAAVDGRAHALKAASARITFFNPPGL